MQDSIKWNGFNLEQINDFLREKDKYNSFSLKVEGDLLHVWYFDDKPRKQYLLVHPQELIVRGSNGDYSSINSENFYVEKSSMKFKPKSKIFNSIQWTGKNEAKIIDFIKSVDKLNRTTFKFDKDLLNLSCLYDNGFFYDCCANIGDWIVQNEDYVYTLKNAHMVKCYECVEG